LFRAKLRLVHDRCAKSSGIRARAMYFVANWQRVSAVNFLHPLLTNMG